MFLSSNMAVSVITVFTKEMVHPKIWRHNTKSNTKQEVHGSIPYIYWWVTREME
jgi:hypothetical protein